jgi:hypothetical protein
MERISSVGDTGIRHLCLQTLLVVIVVPLLWPIAVPFAFLALMNGVRATSALRTFAQQGDPMKAI